jgi:hypothetical protein
MLLLDIRLSIVANAAFPAFRSVASFRVRLGRLLRRAENANDLPSPEKLPHVAQKGQRKLSRQAREKSSGSGSRGSLPHQRLSDGSNVVSCLRRGNVLPLWIMSAAGSDSSGETGLSGATGYLSGCRSIARMSDRDHGTSTSPVELDRMTASIHNELLLNGTSFTHAVAPPNPT